MSISGLTHFLSLTSKGFRYIRLILHLLFHPTLSYLNFTIYFPLFHLQNAVFLMLQALLDFHSEFMDFMTLALLHLNGLSSFPIEEYCFRFGFHLVTCLKSQLHYFISPQEHFFLLFSSASCALPTVAIYLGS
jgi:hypothetical protein